MVAFSRVSLNSLWESVGEIWMGNIWHYFFSKYSRDSEESLTVQITFTFLGKNSGSQKAILAYFPV